jgi:hypothetical protein
MVNYVKKTFAALLLLMMATVANAAVKYTIDDINIPEGDTQTVFVNMENDEPVWIIEFHLTLPEGLTFDENSLKVADRLAGDLQYQLASRFIDKDGSWRISALPLGLGAVPAGKGAILSFEVTAEASLADNSQITFSGETALDPDNKPETVTSENADVAKVNDDYTVTANTEEVMLAKVDATAEIEIALDYNGKTADLWGLQGNIILPAGVTLEGKVEKAARLGSFAIETNKVSDTEYFFYTSSMSDLVSITGTSGTVIKFTVKAGEGVVDGSAIKVNNLKTVDKATEGKINLNSVTVKITTKDPNEEAYKAISEEIAALQKQLDDAKTELAKDAPSVDVTEEAKAIQDQIDALKKTADEAHEAQTLEEGDKLDAEAAKAVTDAITKMVTDAKAKQQEITVGIGAVKAAAAEDEIYTVAGQRVAAPVKGVNIINGKKVILK